MQTDRQTSAEEQTLSSFEKTHLQEFALPVDRQVKIKESEKINKYLEFTSEITIYVECESDGDINCFWSPWNGPRRPG